MTQPALSPTCNQPGMTPWHPGLTARTCSLCRHVEWRELKHKDGE